MSLTFESKAHKGIRIHTLDIQIMIDFRWSTRTAINIHFAYDEFSYTKNDIVNRKKRRIVHRFTVLSMLLLSFVCLGNQDWWQ